MLFLCRWAFLLLLTQKTATTTTATQVAAASSAAVVYTNGNFYTVNPEAPWATAIAVDLAHSNNGVILAVGTEQEALDAANLKAGNKSVSVVDLQGKLVLPGFQDAHLHAVEAGINEQLCYVPEETPARNLASVLKKCQGFERFGSEGWIVGVGVDVGLLIETFNTDFNEPLPIDVLDRAYPRTPILIIDNIGHGAVVNTEALRRVKLLNVAGDVPGGKILRLGNGSPIGIVLESVQQHFRTAAFPESSKANRQLAYESVLQAVEKLNRNGITTVSDAGGFWRQAQTESWVRAESNGKLTVRANNALYVYPETDISTQIKDLKARYRNEPNSLVQFRQAKVYVDGIAELATAAFYDPYLKSLQLPNDEKYGFEYFGSASNLNSVVQTLAENGFQIHFHAVGDMAVGLALDAIEGITNDQSGGKHRVTHCYFIDERDRQRLASLNVVADFQLAPSSLTASYKSFLAQYILGSTRANQLMPTQEILDTGALVTVSSDWDADTLSPLVKLKTILTRQDGSPIDGGLEQIIPLMTLNPAKLLKHDDRTGSIEVGKVADLAVLDKNIFEIPVKDIGSTKVAATIFRGSVVFNITTDGPRSLLGMYRVTGVTDEKNKNLALPQKNKYRLYIKGDCGSRKYCMHLQIHNTFLAIASDESVDGGKTRAVKKVNQTKTPSSFPKERSLENRIAQILSSSPKLIVTKTELVIKSSKKGKIKLK